MKPITKLVVATIFLVFLSAYISIGSQKKPWPVPDAAKNKANPVANTATSVNEGKALWATHCKSCHGTKGLGDGVKASQLTTDPGDFTKNDFQAQTDGSLFYKTSTGRDDMPSFKSKISDPDDIWSLVNYMRSFRKGGAAPTVTTAPAKDTVKTVVKPVEKPVVVTPPPKKDTVIKKEPLTVQEQLSILGKRVDSLEKALNELKARMDSLHK
jgi:mono/diheme cytochrome c family protein